MSQLKDDLNLYIDRLVHVNNSGNIYSIESLKRQINANIDSAIKKRNNYLNQIQINVQSHIDRLNTGSDMANIELIRNDLKLYYYKIDIDPFKVSDTRSNIYYGFIDSVYFMKLISDKTLSLINLAYRMTFHPRPQPPLPTMRFYSILLFTFLGLSSGAIEIKLFYCLILYFPR